jgi:hypothetical protein
VTTLRWRPVLAGAAAFLAAHVVEQFLWTAWFGGAGIKAWFLNSGRAVVATMLCVCVAEVISGYPERDRRELMRGAAGVAGGGIVAMVVTLAVNGPGTIWPLVLIIGGALVIAAAFAGAVVVWAFSAGH